MHIALVQIANYRNFARSKVHLRPGINTIIGENGSGKTNLFRAIRLLLDENMTRGSIRLQAKDFHRGLGDWRGHWIIISIEFRDVSNGEAFQSLLLHANANLEGEELSRATYTLLFRPVAAIRKQLAELQSGHKEGLAAIRSTITIESYEPVLMGRSTLDLSNEASYRQVVGDFEAVIFPTELNPPALGTRLPGIFSMPREVSFTFIQALRDVVSEFQSNRTNPLLTLLRAKSGELKEDQTLPIVKMVEDLNGQIEVLPSVQDMRLDIRTTIREAAGETYSPSALAIRSGLPTNPAELLQSLKLAVGEAEDGYEGAIHELSLGGANLIFLTLKLLEFKYSKDKQSCANFLLIEEPEAHIHTHIQKTLFDRINYPDTQIIYTTHSAQISEVCNVENVNILGQMDGRCEVFHPTAGLSDPQIGNIQRYLDAVRSNLLFAKSVVLVEGDAEEILIPILVRRVLGVSLDELGISLINIRSTGFSNIAVLFHDDRIRKRCAILTDLDSAFVDLNPDPLNDAAGKAASKAARSQKSGQERQVALNKLCAENKWLRAYFSPRTFEVDLIASGNNDYAIASLSNIYTNPATIEQAKADLESLDIARYGARILTMVEHVGKGWFAVLLGKHIDHRAIIPEHVIDAIFFSYGKPRNPVLANIVDYRIKKLQATGAIDEEMIKDLRGVVSAFRDGSVNLADLRAAMLVVAPMDQINPILSRI